MTITFFVYILQSEKDQSFYIGSTNDLERRIAEHNEGKSRYTSYKRPGKIVYTENFPSRIEAVKRERFLKAQRNRSFYQRLIDSRN